METYNLNQTIEKLKGPTKEQIAFYNQSAAVALDKYHVDSSTVFNFLIDGNNRPALLKWDSNFSKVAIKEKKDIANFGGVSLAMFVMSVLLDYKYVEQTEIGDGVDYRFLKEEPNDDELNFLEDPNFHFVEVSGVLEESKTNTLKGRIQDKHRQIIRGAMRNEKSSVIVTLFSKSKVVKEVHK
ncbi:MAG: hypothetical protein K0M40_06455 [Prolixibacteraceae bacterium]|nr:hypothetical protein [Prolixibacteraceae bacterium]